MTLSHPEQGRLLPLAGILAPIGAVVLVRLMLAAGPSEAPAAPSTESLPADAVTAPVSATPKLTPAQEAALQYVRTLSPDGGVRSPMARPAEPAPALERPAPPPTEEYDPTRDLTLSSVVGSAATGIASINGRIYRIGAEVIDGWVLAEVDVRSRTATLTGPDGSTRVLEHRQPE